MKIYPMKMVPVYKEAPWGGSRLREVFGKAIPSDRTGESWELSAHPNGESRPADGDYAGVELSVLTGRFSSELVGSASVEKFPLLFKLIDARDKLSVQVHPNDSLASKIGSKGKTEMWIILAAGEGAGIFAGVRKPLTDAEARTLIAEGKFESALNFIRVHPGDAIFIPAGLIHAIGAGLLVAEIQQSSDITYRVYDYNRPGLDGRPRELHVDKALEAADMTLKGIKSVGHGTDDANGSHMLLTKSKYFSATSVELHGEYREDCAGGFAILFFSDGEGTVECGGIEKSWKSGDTFLIPAEAGNYRVAGNGKYYIFG